VPGRLAAEVRHIPEVIVTAAHVMPVIRAAFSPEDRQVLTGSDGNAAWLWDISDVKLKTRRTALGAKDAGGIFRNPRTAANGAAGHNLENLRIQGVMP